MGKRGLLLAGAALQGIGAGVISHAETVRQRALRQMEIDAANARDAQNRAFQAEENRQNREFQGEQTDKQIGAQQFSTMQTIAAQTTRQRESDASAEERTRMQESGANTRAEMADTRARGLIVSTRTDADGNVKGITAGGEVKDMGFKELKKEMTAEQKLFVDQARLTSATFDPETGRQTGFDAEAMATKLKKSTDPKLRELGEMLATSEDPQAAAAELLAGLEEAKQTNAASAEAGEPTPAANRGLAPKGQAAAPEAANASAPKGDEPPKEAPPKPAQYPDAIWSNRANGWVVQQSNGKWAVVE